MGEETGTVGPDLRRGVPEDQIPDGGMLEGHVDDEPVMLVRRGARIYAIGAKCTHYSGPLAQGLVVGDTVRCPWHHACFDLRTGRALGGPALSPVPCYQVERRLDLVAVTGDARTETTQALTPKSDHPPTIVIVGAGAAGIGAALTLRNDGYGGRLTLIDADASAPYDRPNLSKDYLAGNAPEEWLPLRSHEDLIDADIRLVLGVPVLRIDPGAHAVHLADGRSFPYGALLLATGADPVRLDLPGMDLPHVETLRSLSDSRRLIARSLESKKAVIIGSGFLGLEVAGSLRKRGLEVQVVSPDQRPLEKVLGPELAGRVQRLHQEHGVVFHLGHVSKAITETSVHLDDGSDLEADLVLVAVGARPRVALASRAGIVLAKGIQVDNCLETSVKGIFAAGDVARWPEPRTGKTIGVEHWAFAMRQGQAAARNMLGAGLSFSTVPFFWSQHYDTQINYVGHAEQWDRLHIVDKLPADQWEQHYLVGDTVVAVATIGRDLQSLEFEAAIERAQARHSGGQPSVTR